MADAPAFRTVQIGDIAVANAAPLTLIAGPCQLESLDHAVMIAEAMAQICAEQGLGYVFKASFDKANRTSLKGQRGLGIDEGLSILAEVRARVGCPVLTDVHTADQCAPAAEACDVLQIPAFLCRQTDLLLAAGETGAVINIKKGQFLAPWDMVNVAAKVASTGNNSILLTERGSSFGYNTLVADMRSLPIMARTGYPVVMDATHSVQQPGGQGGSSGGRGSSLPLWRERLYRWALRQCSSKPMKTRIARPPMVPTWFGLMKWGGWWRTLRRSTGWRKRDR